MSTFLVWGAGGHGKVVADLIRSLGHGVAGFVDSEPERLTAVADPGGIRIDQNTFLDAVRRGVLPANATGVVLAVGNNRRRLWCLEQVSQWVAPAFVHPAASVSPSAVFGAGTVVFAGCIVNADAVVGAGVILNSGAIIEHDCHVGDGAHVSPGAVLAGGVRVGKRAWIGAGATVIQNLAIGDDCTVGAGAVVIRPVAAGETVAGVPARSIQAAAR
jgi:sugar O-acyltransferase (sialic acid O-acetyltransferase NeuD family)